MEAPTSAPVDKVEIKGKRGGADVVVLSDYIARVVNSLPPLSPEDRDRLAQLLGGDAA